MKEMTLFFSLKGFAATHSCLAQRLKYHVSDITGSRNNQDLLYLCDNQQSIPVLPFGAFQRHIRCSKADNKMYKLAFTKLNKFGPDSGTFSHSYE
jgi:hypothetical protein